MRWDWLSLIRSYFGVSQYMLFENVHSDIAYLKVMWTQSHLAGVIGISDNWLANKFLWAITCICFKSTSWKYCVKNINIFYLAKSLVHCLQWNI